MRGGARQPKPETWLQWPQENWGGAEMPVDPPAPVVMGAANRLTKIAVRRWLDAPFGELHGLRIAAESLRQQWDVQKRAGASRKAWREHFRSQELKPEWPTGKDARNHTYWKWMEWRAGEYKRLLEMDIQEAIAEQNRTEQEAVYAADTHPWADNQELRHGFEMRKGMWRDTAVWRSVVYACWRGKRQGVEAWPIWMRPQQGGKKGKPRAYPSVPAPLDSTHPYGRNTRLREVFEGLPTISEQRAAVQAITAATGNAPAWMIPRSVDAPKRPGRPRKPPTID